MTRRKRSEDLKPPRWRRKSLPLERWPHDDRVAWEAACRPKSRLRRGGAAGHLKHVSQDDLRRRYACYLDFVDRIGRLDRSAAAGSHVTPELIDFFIQELSTEVTSVTIYGTISKVRQAATYIAPSLELGWLRDFEADLDLLKVPSRIDAPTILTPELLQTGIALCKAAESIPSALKRARTYRNGLIIAMWALNPVRLRSFAALEIGKTLQNINGTWWIILEPDDVKEKRSDERPIDGILEPLLATYLTTHRPILLMQSKSVPHKRSNRLIDDTCSDLRRGTAGVSTQLPRNELSHTKSRNVNALWLSSNDGRQMSPSGLQFIVDNAFRPITGAPFYPHRLRSSGVTTAALYGGGRNPNLGSAILRHRDQRISERSYNKATSLQAALAFSRLIVKL